MQQNILKSYNLSSIYLVYKDAVRHKFLVKLRFIDVNDCYFSTELPPNFIKPKKHTVAELVAYTMDGVYKTQVKINDSSISLDEAVFTVSIPNNWEFIQLRNSTRKRYPLPLILRFNDGFELECQSYDISTGGISFVTAKPIANIYTKVNGSVSFVLPQLKYLPNENNKIVSDVKFLRMLNTEDAPENCYVYKFLNISQMDVDRIKMFLISIE